MNGEYRKGVPTGRERTRGWDWCWTCARGGDMCHGAMGGDMCWGAVNSCVAGDTEGG